MSVLYIGRDNDFTTNFFGSLEGPRREKKTTSEYEELDIETGKFSPLTH